MLIAQAGIAGGYFGGRKAPEIVEWVESKMLPQSQLITDAAEIEKLIAVRVAVIHLHRHTS